jgi:hypothetical protein
MKFTMASPTFLCNLKVSQGSARSCLIIIIVNIVIRWKGKGGVEKGIHRRGMGWGYEGAGSVQRGRQQER